jgi:rhodanese-related sulfurtransferase
MNVKMNREGYSSIDDVLKQGMKALSPDEFELVANETGALLLDVRHETDFVRGFVPRSIFIGLDGTFAPWVGSLIADVQQKILLVVEEERVEEAITRLARVGFDHCIGYLKGGIQAWRDAGKETDQIRSIHSDQFAAELKELHQPVFDVRRASEFSDSHVKDALNTPLDFINDHLSEFPKEKNFFVHCVGGYRSVIAASILKLRGYHNFTEVAGGFSKIKNSGILLSEGEQLA